LRFDKITGQTPYSGSPCLSEIYVHVPVALYSERVDFLLARNLQPEVACQEADMAKLDMEQLADSAAAEAGLKTVLHALFGGWIPTTH